MKFVDTVALIVEKEGRLLVERRKLTKETDPGKVAIPGGHVEGGESLEEACRRELKEELARGVDPKSLSSITQPSLPLHFRDLRPEARSDREGD